MSPFDIWGCTIRQKWDQKKNRFLTPLLGLTTVLRQSLVGSGVTGPASSADLGVGDWHGTLASEE